MGDKKCLLKDKDVFKVKAPEQLISTSMGSSLMPALIFIHHGVDLVNCASKTAPFAPLTLG